MRLLNQINDTISKTNSGIGEFYMGSFSPSALDQDDFTELKCWEFDGATLYTKKVNKITYKLNIKEEINPWLGK